MGFLNNIFGKKEVLIRSYTDFWDWFQKNERTFFKVVKNGEDIEKAFFDKLSPKLSKLKEGYFYLTGMCDDNTVELVFTADGNTKNIVFVEELVEQAPEIKGWKFTALKPALAIENIGIEMGGYKFDSDNLSFYSNDDPDYPDEIDISIAHNDLTEENRQELAMGIYIFLDNYLGELNFVNDVDSLTIIGLDEAKKELVPIAKFKDFLNWRQKEFVEKYEGVSYENDCDEHSILEAELGNGNYLIAAINTQLLGWESKASHPWIGIVTINYDGSRNNGMPNNEDYEKMDQIEQDILRQLSAKDGYINVGRQTADNERKIYFACKDFRKPSKVFFDTVKGNRGSFEIEYDIFKDKYWQTFERFRPNL
ncbi:DUF695 domain-containing protein [Flavobacterium sp. MFBS3-15]|uniref:DUF695 domain-containing protein n=1 Tax=Flavobacterium sp. MFBS3-15 TaxID=2989816 RepID=UPI0022355B45|nr:DUF695 domain-containing protein [Flavobacterium sp. MFBS3-15]MCW4470891.1 DUF695 domain-containing protein [Flavobacterium sp. MFBS3-15]